MKISLPIVLDILLLIAFGLLAISLIFGWEPSRQAYCILLITNIMSTCNLLIRDRKELKK